MKASNTTPEYLRIYHIIGDKKQDIKPIIPVSKATIWNWVKQGKFPKPIKLGTNVTVWNSKEVIKFLEGHH